MSDDVSKAQIGIKGIAIGLPKRKCESFVKWQQATVDIACHAESAIAC